MKSRVGVLYLCSSTKEAAGDVNITRDVISLCCHVGFCRVHAGCCIYTEFGGACFDSVCVGLRVCDGIEESAV